MRWGTTRCWGEKKPKNNTGKRKKVLKLGQDRNHGGRTLPVSRGSEKAIAPLPVKMIKGGDVRIVVLGDGEIGCYFFSFILYNYHIMCSRHELF